MSIAQTNIDALVSNSYPGRGIVIGRSSDGKLVLQVYWIMGRSANSRNRLLVKESDKIKTVPYDESKVEDPSLIIYNAMRTINKTGSHFHIVSNGDQTDTIADYLERGKTVEEAIQSRSYEPDAPNFTSRICGIIKTGSWGAIISITRRNPASGEVEHSFFNDPLAVNGLGSCIHTYQSDGDPLPPFKGNPYQTPLGRDTEDTSRMYWERLNSQNRVAIVVKSINIQTSETGYLIINRHDQV